MPKEYEDYKAKNLAKGMSEKEAKKHAAMLYNWMHPGHPLIRWIQKHEGKRKGGGK